MTAPVVGFSAEVDKGLRGASYVEVDLFEADGEGQQIEVTITYDHAQPPTYNSIILTHDEARQVIAGLASVIT